MKFILNLSLFFLRSKTKLRDIQIIGLKKAQEIKNLLFETLIANVRLDLFQSKL